MNHNGQNLGPLPPTSDFNVIIEGPRSSQETDTSANERLQWRNHPQVLTPNPEKVEKDPFDALVVAPPIQNEDADVSGSSHEATQSQRTPKPVQEKRRDSSRGKASLSWRQRIRHFTWTWFTLTMATGGIANVLYTVPYRFRGLYAIGCIFFILNIVFFLFNVTMISLRFYFFPRTFKASFLHPTESLFIPSSLVSFGIILINITQYGVGSGVGDWLERCMIVLFWLDCGLAAVSSLLIYLIM